MKKIITAIANLKITYKIWLCMMTISLTLSAFLISFSIHYFSWLYREDSYSQTADSLHIGSQSITDSYEILLKNVIDMASTNALTKLVQDVHLNRHDNDVIHKAALQQPLDILTASIPILDSLVILGKNGEYYSLYTNTLKKGYTTQTAFNWDFSSVTDITWLKMCPSPFIKNNQIIPVIIPVSQFPNTQYLHICRDPAKTDICIVLLLDAKKVNERLALANSSYSERVLYLANEQGMPLSLPESSPCRSGNPAAAAGNRPGSYFPRFRHHDISVPFHVGSRHESVSLRLSGRQKKSLHLPPGADRTLPP